MAFGTGSTRRSSYLCLWGHGVCRSHFLHVVIKNPRQFRGSQHTHMLAPREKVPAHFQSATGAKSDDERSVSLFFETLSWVKQVFPCVVGDLPRKLPNDVERLFLDTPNDRSAYSLSEKPRSRVKFFSSNSTRSCSTMRNYESYAPVHFRSRRRDSAGCRT